MHRRGGPRGGIRCSDREERPLQNRLVGLPANAPVLWALTCNPVGLPLTEGRNR